MVEGLCSLLEYLVVSEHVKNGDSSSYWFVYFLSSISQVNIPKRCTLIQVLPQNNAYTKSAHAYNIIHFAKFFCYLLMHVSIFIAIRPVCVHIGCLIAILRQNAYMH